MNPENGHLEISKSLKQEFKIAAAIKGMTMKEATEIAVQHWLLENGFSVSTPS